MGFPLSYSFESSYSFFADLCVEIWEHAVQHNLRTFDIEIKKAQLKGLRISSSVLLVDESQDMDQCQVDWIDQQKQHGTHVYFVGDMAQCIYGFRGAKSKVSSHYAYYYGFALSLILTSTPSLLDILVSIPSLS